MYTVLTRALLLEVSAEAGLNAKPEDISTCIACMCTLDTTQICAH